MGADSRPSKRAPLDIRILTWARRRSLELGRMPVPRAFAELWAVIPRDRVLRWVRWAGLVLVVLAFVAMTRVVGDAWSGLRGWRPTPQLATVVVGCGLVWAGVTSCLGFAWSGLVQGFSGTPVRRRDLWWVFARLQVSRYLPGNTFQVGRHLLARGVGVGHATLVASAIVEAVVLIAAAAALSVAGISRLAVPAVAPSPSMLAVLAGIGVLVVALAFILTARLKPLLNLPGRHGSAMIRALGLDVLYMVTGGLVLAALMAAQGRVLQLDDLGGLVAAFALAWLTGFMAPAAPEGVGVREAVLLTLLGGADASSEQLVAVVLLRLVFLCGDGLLALVTGLVFRGRGVPEKDGAEDTVGGIG